MDANTTKKELLQEKFNNFKLYLSEITPENKQKEYEAYKNMGVEDLTSFLIKNYNPDTKLHVVASRIILGLDCNVSHLAKIEKYLNFFVAILEL